MRRMMPFVRQPTRRPPVSSGCAACCDRGQGRRTDDRLSAVAFFCERGWGLGMSAGSACRPVSIAVTTKTRSPQTIGVDAAESGQFRLPFDIGVGVPLYGRLASRAVPLARGPRQWCQLSSRCWVNSSARKEQTMRAKKRVKIANLVMQCFQRSSSGGLFWEYKAGASRSEAGGRQSPERSSTRWADAPVRRLYGRGTSLSANGISTVALLRPR